MQNGQLADFLNPEKIDGMKTPNFLKMSDAELASYTCQSQEEAEALSKEQDFREWCKENEIDPDEQGSREHYREATGESFWEDLDDDDRNGWEHNMNKD